MAADATYPTDRFHVRHGGEAAVPSGATLDIESGGTLSVAGTISVTGTATLSASPALTTPKITTSINDANGNEVIKTPATSSAVNEITVTNSATGNAVSIAATGGDTNIDLTVAAKGAGEVKVGQATSAGVRLVADQPILDSAGNELVKFVKATTAVNEVTVTNSATGDAVSLSATGTDTNIPFAVAGKGTGEIRLGQATSTGVKLVADQPIVDSAGNELVKFVKTTSAVNELTVTNAATGNGPALSATGGDSNINVVITPKGTGTVSTAANVTAAGYTTTSTAHTATADGTGTGTIAAGTGFVTVTSDNADKIIILPAPVVGHVVRLINGGTGYELRSSDPATIAINGGTGVGAESAIAASSYVECRCVTATAWIANYYATDGTEAKVEAAAAP